MDANDKTLCTIYIVRHGQTEWNVERRIQGQEDSPLTALGLSQAKELGQLLQGVHFNAVFSSDSLRAKRTAEMIVLERELAVVTTELLRERAFGRFEGKYIAELKEFDEIFEKLSDEEKFSYKSESDIESDEEIASRMIRFIREIAVRFAGKTVLLVTHAGMMKALLVHLGYGTYQTLPNGSIKNTSYIKLATDGIEFFVNETMGITFQKDVETHSASSA